MTEADGSPWAALHRACHALINLSGDHYQLVHGHHRALTEELQSCLAEVRAVILAFQGGLPRQLAEVQAYAAHGLSAPKGR